MYLPKMGEDESGGYSMAKEEPEKETYECTVGLTINCSQEDLFKFMELLKRNLHKLQVQSMTVNPWYPRQSGRGRY